MPGAAAGYISAVYEQVARAWALGGPQTSPRPLTWPRPVKLLYFTPVSMLGPESTKGDAGGAGGVDGEVPMPLPPAPAASAVQVCIRVRPLIAREYEAKESEGVEILGPRSVCQSGAGGGTYEFGASLLAVFSHASLACRCVRDCASGGSTVQAASALAGV